MISWGKTDMAQIVNGVHDDYIRQRSAAVAALGKPVFLRWFWEMDGHQNGNGGFFDVAPNDYIAAWRHIYDIFAAQGTTNAVWVWCPNAWNFETGRSQQYYPGDAYVDWTCADGYNWFPARGKDQGFKEIFQAFYDWASVRGKPLMIGEWGVMESGAPERKAAWLSDARTTLKSIFPKIAAVVYFNHKGLPHEPANIDWRIETSAPAVQAFTALASDPYFNPGVGGGAPPPVIPEVRFPFLLPVSALAVILVIAPLSRRRWRPAT
jgi:beta-mannanase